ncbi:DUF2514 family protein [Pseudomonas putida]|uniref:DUF2514 family protein n=1 Tax=Pseudomonas putida TaxID=303 RepID=UPI003C6E684E
MRDESTQLATAISCPGTDTAAIASGQAATRAAMVLSDLLDRSVATNRELAQDYDRAKIAGLACEASYNALIN